jgi:mitogen-activated protein kinase 15
VLRYCRKCVLRSALTTLCMFLQELNNHENIIKLWNVLRADNDKDIYLVFECASHLPYLLLPPVGPAPISSLPARAPRRYMDTDLHHVIRANILEEVHKQYIMYQLLKSLKCHPHAAASLRFILTPLQGTCTRLRCFTET